MGAVDELSAFIGSARVECECEGNGLSPELEEVRVRLLDGAQDSPRPREVSPALVICLERILDHLCFILIIIVNKM